MSTAYKMTEPVVSGSQRKHDRPDSLCKFAPVLGVVELEVVLAAEFPVELLDGYKLLQLRVEPDLRVSCDLLV